MFDVILADPPWEFKTWSNLGREKGPKYLVSHWRNIARYTPPGAPDSALFMWACWPLLPDALALIRAWGYTFVDIAFTWAKLSETGNAFHTGLGYYTRANSEPCLVATRGNYPLQLEAASPLIIAPLPPEHSRKPDEQYNLIDYSTGPGRRLEMFARRPRAGWSVWGNEVQSDIVIKESM